MANKSESADGARTEEIGISYRSVGVNARDGRSRLFEVGTCAAVGLLYGGIIGLYVKLINRLN